MASILLLGAVPFASAACPSPAPTSVLLSTHLTAAQQAWASLDVTRFRDLMGQVDADLPCVSDEISRHLAAELHRYEGLLAFLDRDTDKSTRAFAAARSIEPTYRFPDAVVPAGNPVLTDYTSLDPDNGRTVRVAPALNGRLQIDGAVGASRSTDFPAVVQLFDLENHVKSTSYLWPQDPLPAYTPGPMPTVGGLDPNGHRQNVTSLVHQGPNRSWLTGAIVAAAVSGGLYGGAFVVHKQYYDTGTPLDRLDGLRTVNNSLVLASGTAALTAVGLGTGAFLVARF